MIASLKRFTKSTPRPNVISPRVQSVGIWNVHWHNALVKIMNLCRNE
jgi:hypothetical protein